MDFIVWSPHVRKNGVGVSLLLATATPSCIVRGTSAKFDAECSGASLIGLIALVLELPSAMQNII